MFRKRPFMTMPARSYYYHKSDRTSSFISMNVVFACTGVWVLLQVRGDIHSVFIYLTCFITWIVVSYIKVLGGAIYPSDALLSLPLIILNIGLYEYIVHNLDKFETKHNMGTDPFIINRANFVSFLESNKVLYSEFITFTAIFIFGTVISMLHPISLTKKTPLWIAIPLIFFIFNNMLASPNRMNSNSCVNR